MDMAEITLEDVKDDIQGIVVSYLKANDEGDDYTPVFISIEIDSLIDEYKSLRSYPDSVDDETIEADVIRYFNRRKSYIGTQVIPAILTKVGAEGLETMIDNQVSKYWGKSFENYFKDVVPYCEVI